MKPDGTILTFLAVGALAALGMLPRMGSGNREWGPLDFEEAHDKADRLRGKFFTVAFQVDERPDGFYVIEMDVN